MKTFEIQSKDERNGRRNFKVILHRIFPDDCVNESEQLGTMYNDNGITWIREYCEKALNTIAGMPLRCAFLDEDRTELAGHGLTDIIDGEPVFEEACMIGSFTGGYIDEVENEDGETILAVIGEGEIDAACYHNFVEKLEEDMANGDAPYGSVEIMHTPDNEKIQYVYGYKDKGRIPMDFIYSGLALLGVSPADHNSKLIELNETQNKEDKTMNETEMKALVSQVVAELSNHTAEMNQCIENCNAQVAEANEARDNAVAELNELNASVAEIQAALEAAKAELDEKYQELDALHAELCTLRKELGEAKARERVGEMNNAVANFTDEEKAYAAAEMEAFNADPMSVEINAIVEKIYEGIGRASKEADSKEVETNEAEVNIEDIFAPMSLTEEPEDLNIF